MNKTNRAVSMDEEKLRICFCHFIFAEEKFLGFKCLCFICQYEEIVIAGRASPHSPLTSDLQKILLADEKAKMEHA